MSTEVLVMAGVGGFGCWMGAFLIVDWVSGGGGGGAAAAAGMAGEPYR